MNITVEIKMIHRQEKMLHPLYKLHNLTIDHTLKLPIIILIFSYYTTSLQRSHGILVLMLQTILCDPYFTNWGTARLSNLFRIIHSIAQKELRSFNIFHTRLKVKSMLISFILCCRDKQKVVQILSFILILMEGVQIEQNCIIGQ